MSKEIKEDFLILLFCAIGYGFSFLPVFSPFSVIICALVALISAREMIKEGFLGIFHLDFGEDTLMFIAVCAAFVIGEFHEGAMVALLFSLGEEMEDLAIERSEKNITALADIRPDYAYLIQENEIIKTPAQDVPVGTEIFVKVGERVPLDMEILDSAAVADLSALTGESLPVNLEPGDILKAGSIVLASPVKGKTVSGYGDSAAARILDMVKNASEKKGETEKFITRFSHFYTPVVVLLAGLVFLLTHYLGNLSFSSSAHRALVFLVSSCPCALVLSIPLAYFAGIGAASKLGIIIKGSEFCEKLAKAKNAVFDKTGTITSGKLHVSDVISLSDKRKEEILQYAASADRHSSHPAALCICEEAENQNLFLLPAEKIHEISGEGIHAVVDGKKVAVGNRKLFEKDKINIPSDRNEGIFVAIDGILSGAIDFEDTPRPESKSTIAKLHELGIRQTVLLTGDRETAAKKISDICGIKAYYASLMPEDKVEKLEKIKTSGITIFTGDGINDAPVLAAADIGAAIGMGSDAAVESADIVLMKNGISLLPDAIRISRKIMKCVRQNIAFILAVKIIVLLLGAFGYSPIWLAVFADVGVCLLTVLWSIRMAKI